MTTIHVNLVSGNLTPNLIPTLGYRDDCKGVVLVTGDSSMSAQAERLANIYSSKGIPVLQTFNCGTSSDYKKLLEAAESLAAQLAESSAESMVMLNATCGTKPMAFAFAQVFNKYIEKGHSFGVIYTDTQNVSIPILRAEGGNLAMVSALDLKTYLTAFGFTADKENPEHIESETEKRRELTTWLAKKLLGDNRGFVGALNYLSSMALKDYDRDGQFYSAQTFKHKPNGFGEDVCQRLHDEGFWRWDGHKQIEFTTPESARFLNGIWLEEYALWCAKEAGIEHIGMGVEGAWESSSRNRWLDEPTNEFDLMLVHNNQMLLVECKTANLQASGSSQEVVNKLEAFSRKLLGGQFGKGLLLSSAAVPEHAEARINAYGLNVLQHSELKQLTRYFREWKASVEPRAS